MKTKKNAGFSLVELIVVIAIMAVLVGVLAPAYLKYVEKSRKSTDVSAVADIITAASTVAADVEFDIPAGATFNVASTSGSIALSVTIPSTDAAADASKATSGWKSVAKCENGYTCKSKEFKAAANQTITGTVQNNGSVDWALPTAAGTFKAMVDYSKDLKSKFE